MLWKIIQLAKDSLLLLLLLLEMFSINQSECLLHTSQSANYREAATFTIVPFC